MPADRALRLAARLTVAEAETALHQLRVRRARRRLVEFMREGWHVLEPGVPLDMSWHIEAVADHVQWTLEDWMQASREPGYAQRAQNLLINIPPGSLKSRIVSVYAPAWMWLHWPSWRVICLSVNPDVARRDAMLSRELITSEWYRSWFAPQWELRDDQDALSNFGNTAGGWRSSKGFTAKVVGQRGDAIFVDDPNDPHEVFSEAHRRDVNGRWDASIANRVNDLNTSVRIGIMQRLHEEDWSGHVLRQGGWALLALPQEFEPDRACVTPFGWRDPRTQPGELLHPKRFPPAALAAERMRLGSYGYAGQHQQRPAPLEGGMFKRPWWRWFALEGQQVVGGRPRGCDTAPARAIGLAKLDWLAISVDAAFKSTNTGSRVGMLVIGGIGADRFVLDNRTRPMTFSETVATIRALRAQYPQATRVLVEDKANGPAIVDTLKTEVSGIIEVSPEGGKEARAAAITPAVEAGNVYLLDGAPWAGDFVDELAVFPNGSHDDQLDALSQCLIHMGTSPGMARALALCAW